MATTKPKKSRKPIKSDNAPNVDAALQKLQSAAHEWRSQQVATAAADDLDHINTAAESLSAAVQTLSAMAATFSDDGSPLANIADVAGGIRMSIVQLQMASEALFSNAPGDWVYKPANSIVVKLWDAADIVMVVGASLETGKWPDGHGMTNCPIGGALKLAIGHLKPLVPRVNALREQCRTSLAQHVERHNRDWRRQHPEARP